MLSHEYGHVTDPFEVVTAMFNAAVAAGARYQQASVDELRHDGETHAGIVVAGEERTFDAVLVTAGVWSKDIATSIRTTCRSKPSAATTSTIPARPSGSTIRSSSRIAASR